MDFSAKPRRGPQTDPLGGRYRPPQAIPVGANKRAVQGTMIPAQPQYSTQTHTAISPLVKRGDSRYNGHGAEILLCGRSHLLHRGVGRFQLSTSRPLFALSLLYCMILGLASSFFPARTIPGRFLTETPGKAPDYTLSRPPEEADGGVYAPLCRKRAGRQTFRSGPLRRALTPGRSGG